MDPFLVQEDVWKIINRYSYRFGKTFEHITKSFKSSILSKNLSLIEFVCNQIVKTTTTVYYSEEFINGCDDIIGFNFEEVLQIVVDNSTSEICMHVLILLAKSEHFHLSKYERLCERIVQIVFRDKDVKPILSSSLFEDNVIRICQYPIDYIFRGLTQKPRSNILSALPLVQWYHQKFNPRDHKFYRGCIVCASRMSDISLLDWVIQTIGKQSRIPYEYIPKLSVDRYFQTNMMSFFKTTDMLFYQKLYDACPEMCKNSQDIRINISKFIVNNQIEIVKWIITHYDKICYFYDKHTVMRALLSCNFQILEILQENDSTYLYNKVSEIFKYIHHRDSLWSEYTVLEFSLRLEIERNEKLRNWIRNVCGISPDTGIIPVQDASLPLYQYQIHFSQIMEGLAKEQKLYLLIEARQRMDNITGFYLSKTRLCQYIYTWNGYVLKNVIRHRKIKRDFKPSPRLMLLIIRYLYHFCHVTEMQRTVSICFPRFCDLECITTLIHVGLWIWHTYQIRAIDAKELYRFYMSSISHDKFVKNAEVVASPHLGSPELYEIMLCDEKNKCASENAEFWKLFYKYIHTTTPKN